MEGGSSWVRQYHYCANFDPWETTRNHGDFEPFSEGSDEENKATVSVDSILPDDLLERILAYLPIASIFRAGCVCKRWNGIVSSKRFLWDFSHALARKPWYFMFTSTDYGIGYAYDPSLRKWYSLDLPDFVTSNWNTASSCGLVCFMDSDTRNEICVCNLLTKSIKLLLEAPGLKFCDYSALAISVNRVSQGYKVSIVKSKQVPDNFYQWDLSVHVYDSETMLWMTPLTEVLNGWRAGDESVICDGSLYFMIYSTGVGLPDHTRHGLIRYNLSSRQSHGLLMRNFIPVPCSLTCGRLMNLKEKLVMVGGIGKQDRSDIIKGIGIWVLNATEWQEIARMPHKLLQGFGELDDVFASSGTDDLIYIHSYGGPALLVYDMNNRQWKWSQKCPVPKKFPLQLFTGFCFEPRLDIAP